MRFLFQATIGHLGKPVQAKDWAEAENDLVYLPYYGCVGDECYQSRAYAGVFYSFADTLAIIIFLISYLWLRHFEVALNTAYRRHQVRQVINIS